MSDDDKNKKDSTSGDGAGSGTSGTDAETKVGFGELAGWIDSRIEALLGKRGTNGADKDAGTSTTGGESPQSVAAQVRAEIAKLSGEKEAADKDAARDVTIEELKAQVAQLKEAPPTEKVSRLTEIMWGRRDKK